MIEIINCFSLRLSTQSGLLLGIRWIKLSCIAFTDEIDEHLFTLGLDCHAGNLTEIKKVSCEVCGEMFGIILLPSTRISSSFQS